MLQQYHNGIKSRRSPLLKTRSSIIKLSQNNADQIYGSINYRFIRGLQATFWAEYIRKGGDGVVDDQYTLPSKEFLFGLRKNYTNWGFQVKYEFIHELFAKFNYQSYLSSVEQEDGTVVDTRYNDITFAVYYGL